MVSEKSPF